MITPEQARRELQRRYEARAELEARNAARNSTLAFAQYTHPRWQTGEHHKLICDKLDAVERGEIKRLLIVAPPRHTKSELASVRFPPYLIGKKPSRQILAASYGAELAVEFGADVIDLMRSRRYQAVFPGVRLRPDAQARGAWKTQEGGCYHATGVGGSLTGKGADVFIADDPFKTREEADSPTHRDKIWRWFWGVARTRLMPGGAIIVMNTRWHEDDLTGRLMNMASEKWDLLHLPAISGEGENERALWPEWFPLEEMRKLRAQLLEAGRAREWWSQYQGEPRAEEGEFFLRKWFEERWA